MSFLYFLSTENPVCFEEGYRVEVLVSLRRLERLDQDVYLEDERQEAEEVRSYCLGFKTKMKNKGFRNS